MPSGHIVLNSASLLCVCVCVWIMNLYKITFFTDDVILLLIQTFRDFCSQYGIIDVFFKKSAFLHLKIMNFPWRAHLELKPAGWATQNGGNISVPLKMYKLSQELSVETILNGNRWFSVPFHQTLRHPLKAVPGFATILRRRLNGFQVGRMTLAFKIKSVLSWSVTF